MRRNRPFDYAFVLSLILVAAALLRAWGIDFGLPNTRAHPDESLLAHTAVHIMGGEWNPGFFDYPSLFLYAEAAVFAGYCGFAALSGRFDGLAACAASWPRAWEPFFLSGRMLSAFAGTAGVAIVFAVARRAAPRADGRDALSGLVAAGCLAVAFLHVRDSHFGVTDVAMTTLVLLALVLLLRADERPSPRAFAAAGFVAGLAASTKYNAVLLGAGILVSQLFALRKPAAAVPSTAPRVDFRVPIFAAAMAIAFVLGTPYALLDRGRFLANVRWESHHLATGHGVVLETGWRYHALVTLPLAVGWPLLVGGIAGAGLTFARRPRAASIIFIFPVLYYIVAGRGLTVFARYMDPIVPFVCIGAGALAAWLHERVTLAAGPRAAQAVTVLLVAACVLPTLAKAAALDVRLSRTDSRVLAAEWMAAHVRDGQLVYVSASQWGRPDLNRRGSAPPFRVEGDEDRPLASAQRPDWVVIQESPLLIYDGALRAGALPPGYELRQTVRAYNPSIPHVYDQQDAFFLPLDGFAGVARPGPNFLIYEKRP